MVSVKIQGGLGNQLFQYAFARAQSARKAEPFCLSDGFGYDYLLPSFFENIENKPSLFSNLTKKLSSQKKFDVENQWLSPSENLANFDAHKNTFYEGFFQSEQYFSDYKNKLCHDFEIKKKYQIDARRWLGMAPDQPYVAFHIRGGDYADFGNEELGGQNLCLPFDYYAKAWQLVCPFFFDSFHAVWVSDENPKMIEQKMQLFENQQLIRHHFVRYPQEIMDFQTLMQANIIVTANSSFSWWAAYLSQATQIFAPQHWLGYKIGQEFPCQIIPKNWSQIKIF